MNRSYSFFLAPLVAGSLTLALPAASQTAEIGAENYRQADANGDGVLAYAEFATFIDLNAADGLGNAARVSSRGLHARAFERVDANGDGVVSPQELQAVQ
jgi:Ca2+-binding EF-hand superfamily protein